MPSSARTDADGGGLLDQRAVTAVAMYEVKVPATNVRINKVNC